MITHKGQTYKVVVTTPAGREVYMSIFKKYIYKKMKEGLVDGWQIWQNTVKPNDIAYLASMEAENPKVKRYFIENLEDKYNGSDTFRTCEFFRNCHDNDTIYIRFDDDIVWAEDDAIRKMCIARIENPYSLCIYPTVINSTYITSLHQASGVLGKEAGEVHQWKEDDPNWAYLDEFNYTDSKLIDLIHDTFKKNYEAGTLNKYYLPSRVLEKYERFSICSLAWWGKDKINPGSLEEAQMSWELPHDLNKPNYLLGDALMVHYAYHTQRDYLESCTPQKLEFYKTISQKYDTQS